jgi:hypothetical protein
VLGCGGRRGAARLLTTWGRRQGHLDTRHLTTKNIHFSHNKSFYHTNTTTLTIGPSQTKSSSTQRTFTESALKIA